MVPHPTEIFPELTGHIGEAVGMGVRNRAEPALFELMLENRFRLIAAEPNFTDAGVGGGDKKRAERTLDLGIRRPRH